MYLYHLNFELIALKLALELHFMRIVVHMFSFVNLLAHSTVKTVKRLELFLQQIKLTELFFC